MLGQGKKEEREKTLQVKLTGSEIKRINQAFELFFYHGPAVSSNWDMLFCVTIEK